MLTCVRLALSSASTRALLFKDRQRLRQHQCPQPRVKQCNVRPCAPDLHCNCNPFGRTLDPDAPPPSANQVTCARIMVNGKPRVKVAKMKLAGVWRRWAEAPAHRVRRGVMRNSTAIAIRIQKSRVKFSMGRAAEHASLPMRRDSAGTARHYPSVVVYCRYGNDSEQ